MSNRDWKSPILFSSLDFLQNHPHFFHDIDYGKRFSLTSPWPFRSGICVMAAKCISDVRGSNGKGGGKVWNIYLHSSQRTSFKNDPLFAPPPLSVTNSPFHNFHQTFSNDWPFSVAITEEPQVILFSFTPPPLPLKFLFSVLIQGYHIFWTIYFYCSHRFFFTRFRRWWNFTS